MDKKSRSERDITPMRMTWETRKNCWPGWRKPAPGLGLRESN